jgi:hypothetical protein
MEFDTSFRVHIMDIVNFTIAHTYDITFHFTGNAI